MLGHDARRDAAAAACRHQRLGARRRNLQRFFEQQMLPGDGTSADDVEMRIRGRQHRHGIHQDISKQGIKAVAQGKWISLREAAPPCTTRTEGVRDFDLVGKIECAPRMRVIAMPRPRRPMRLRCERGTLRSATSHPAEPARPVGVDGPFGCAAFDDFSNLRDGFERLMRGRLRRESADVRGGDDFRMAGERR